MEQLDKSVRSDRRKSAKVKGKIYRTQVRPAMMSGLESRGGGHRISIPSCCYQTVRANWLDQVSTQPHYWLPEKRKSAWDVDE